MTADAAAPADLPGTPAYPAHWEADVLLADGGVARLRPLVRDDARRVEEFHSRLSPQTVYFRYFAPRPRLSRRDLMWLVDVDHDARVALAALRGEELLAVVRYDRLPDAVAEATAEVAFVVRDDQQGRGLGGVMLEHLAAAAAERGVRRFVAEVLGENRRMLATFSAAGYSVEREVEDGTVHVSFDIAPTGEALRVRREREHRAEARSIARLLAPRAVAVVGAGREGGLGHAVLRNVLEAGYAGAVHPVHPTRRSVAGVRAWPTVADVPDDVDLVVVAVPAPAVAEVVAQAAAASVHALVVLSVGFAEAGPDGARLQEELLTSVRAAGMRLLGPACLGLQVTDPEVRLNASLAGTLPRRGGAGLFSQSGGLGAWVAGEAARRGLGMSAVVSAGNRADVSGNDLLQFWEDDEATDQVLLHLESFGNPRKFLRLARRVARRKPVVLVRTPALEVGGRPASGAAVDDLFRGAGVLRTDSLEQMLDTAVLLSAGPLPAGPRTAVLGNSPALVRIVVQAAQAAGLEPHARDLGSSATAADLAHAVRSALASGAADSVVVTFTPTLASSVPEVREALAAAVRAARDEVPDAAVPVVAVLVDATGTPERGPAGPVPVFDSPEAAVLALGRVVRHAWWLRRGTGGEPELDGVDLPAARSVVGRVLSSAPDGRDLGPAECAELLDAVGLRLVEQVEVREPQEAVAAAERLGWPVALKAAADELRHREDLGGLRLDVGGGAELRDAVAQVGHRVRDLLRDDEPPVLLVQAMVERGVPCVVGLDDDPVLGPVVSFGTGGVVAELLADRVWRALPLHRVDVDDLLDGVRGRPLLDGWRGAPAADLDALRDVVARLARLGELPELRSAELNPVVAAPGGAAVLSAAVRVAPPRGRPDEGPRRLGAPALPR